MTYQLSDFDYHLPPELIAKEPTVARTGSRLLVCQAGEALVDEQFSCIEQYLNSGDLLIFNNTRVIPARLHGQKATGGAIECLVERLLGEHEALVHLKSSKSPKAGSELSFAGGELQAVVMGRDGALFHLRFAGEQSLLSLLEQHGEIPLPPYMERPPEATDQVRYQTVYAKHPGAVAAPTAGLHFDEALIARLQAKGVQTAEVTLHVGAGTFQPVRVEDLAEHVMHSEWAQVSAEVCARIAATKAAGGRVVAVGTTVMRSLESAAASGELQPLCDETNLFITPGYRFNVVDVLLTNFHLPGSTLLMLIAAFGGYEEMMAAYAHAIAARYRFFSYGDAMLIEKNS
jgi:S-adenosylmethionine:tRNA ribosyltransferase-isomerase